MTRSPAATSTLLAGAALLLTTWSLVVPVFEGPDEPAHWQYARHLHDHWRLPQYGREFGEANSPPLYYALIAPLAIASPLPTMVLAEDEQGGLVSLAPPRDFYNTDRDFARYGPIRLGRLASAALSVLTIWVTCLAGRAATGRADTGLLAALLVGTLPQFTFRGMNVSNDALVALLSAATTLGCVRLICEGFTWRRAIGTAVALGFAYLSKINALALAAPVAMSWVAAPESGAARNGSLLIRRRAMRLSILALPLALALPWSLWNVVLYGDPFASGAMRSAVREIITDRSLFSAYFVGDFPLLLAMSSIGIFGWANVLLPAWAYAIYLALGLAALIGLARGWLTSVVSSRLLAMLLLTVLATLAIVVYVNLSFTQPQDRYMFPALTAVAVLAALGLQSVTDRWRGWAVPVALGALLAALNVYALIGVVRPAYLPPLARDIAPGVRALSPAVLSSLAFAPATQEFVVKGPDPWWIAPLDEDASSFGVVEITLRASLEPATRRGCVYFATDRQTASVERLCFTWVADGTAQQVAVDMRAARTWSGRVTHLRIDALDDEAPPAIGSRVRLEAWRLRAAPPR